jgi:hypothetical protein
MKQLQQTYHVRNTWNIHLQHPDLLLQHPDENTCNIRLIQTKHLEHTLETYMHSHCNMCNILIYFCNTDMKHFNITLKHLKHLKHIFATCTFSATTSCCLGIVARRCLEFIGVKLTTPVENTTVLLWWRRQTARWRRLRGRVGHGWEMERYGGARGMARDGGARGGGMERADGGRAVRRVREWVDDTRSFLRSGKRRPNGWTPYSKHFRYFYSISISVINYFYFDAIFYKLTRQGKE